jgi:hypothetical protein
VEVGKANLIQMEASQLCLSECQINYHSSTKKREENRQIQKQGQVKPFTKQLAEEPTRNPDPAPPSKMLLGLNIRRS